MENSSSRLSNYVRTINNMTQWRDILPNNKSNKMPILTGGENISMERKGEKKAKRQRRDKGGAK